jgi:hypothetical protein
MAFTQADLDAIDAALKRGESSVSFADRRVDYRSVEELLLVRELVSKSIAGRPKQTLVVASKGFGC